MAKVALLALATLIGSGSVAATAEQPRASVFGPPSHFGAGVPRVFGISAPAADLNGDGSIDLAVTSEGTASDPAGGRLVIMANNGSGSFAVASTFPLLLPSDIGPPPALSVGRGVAAVDVTGDGRPEVLVVDAGKPQFAAGDVPGFLLVYRNDGGGTFTRLPAMRVGRRPLGMAIADFNGDGRPDIGIDLEDEDGLQVLAGRGDGTFTIAQTRAVPCDSPHFPAAGDFTGDGQPDLLIPCNNNGPVLLFPGIGDGTLGAPVAAVSPPVVARPHQLAVADFDGPPSNHLDFAVANTGSIGGRVSVLLGAGGGTFAEQPGSPYPGTPANTTPFIKAADITGRADLTGDNRPDLLFVSAGNNVPNFLVLLERNATGFRPAVGSPYAIGTTLLRELTVADFNGDGQNDTAVVERPASPANGSVAVLLHNPPLPNRTLSGDVSGPVVVASGEVVRISNARVAGSITVAPGGSLSVDASQVSGGVVANDPSSFSVCGSQIAAPPGSPSQGIVVTNATVPLRIGDPAAGCAGNAVSGGVSLTANQGGLTLGSNRVSGSVTVSNNTVGTPVVKANTIAATLDCAGNNQPPPTPASPTLPEPRPASALPCECRPAPSGAPPPLPHPRVSQPACGRATLRRRHPPCAGV